MKTKINEIPLVGLRGRKELLKRINELEAQVAQQDYLRISVENPGALTAEEKRQIKETAERGVLLDALIVCDGEESRVISVHKDDKRAAIYSLGDEGIVTISWVE